MVRVRRRVAAIGTLVLCAWLGLTACTPGEATPTPTPTGFTSEEEAFAAAEATYRAYVDAVNAQRAGEPAANPQQYLSGEALTIDIETQRQLLELEARIQGATQIEHINALAVDSERGVQLSICLDLRDTRVIDAYGQDITPEGRPERQTLLVTLVPAQDQWLIARSENGADTTC